MNKKNILFLVLGGIFITNAIVAELVGGKIFSLEGSIGITPFQFSMFGGKWDFNLTAGVILWPVVFITTDIINEYFGKDGVKKISYLTVLLISYTFLVVYFITKLSPATFWTEGLSTDENGNYLDINYAFSKIFTQGLRIIIGSLIAFLIGQFLDVYVFHKLRKITGSKYLWLRATGSTLVSQFIDSFVVLFIAFYGVFSLKDIMATGIVNYIYKFSIAILITPLLYVAHYYIDKYLGKENADELIKEASKNS